MCEERDVVIVGAGLVGLALALQLAQHSSLRITVLGNQPIDPLKEYPTLDYRVIAINASTQRYLKNLSLWSELEQQPLGRFEQMRIWDATEPKTSIDWKATQVGLPELGYIVSLPYLVQLMNQHIKRYPQIQVRMLPLQKIERTEEAIKLHTPAEMNSFSAPLLLAADGGQSWVRHELNFSWEEHLYPHHSLTMVVRTALPHESIARQIFTPQGPLAFLPMHDPYQSTVVWSIPAFEAAAWRDASPDACAHALTQAFQGQLGEVKEILSQRATFELIYRHASQYIQPRVALLGDAAHTFHPLAGLGGNLGLADAQVMGESILNAWERKRDIGGWDVLKRYQRHRRWHNALYGRFLGMIVNVFESNQTLWQPWRGQGMKCIQRLVPLKWASVLAAEYFV